MSISQKLQALRAQRANQPSKPDEWYRKFRNRYLFGCGVFVLCEIAIALYVILSRR